MSCRLSLVWNNIIGSLLIFPSLLPFVIILLKVSLSFLVFGHNNIEIIVGASPICLILRHTHFVIMLKTLSYLSLFYCHYVIP